MKNICCHFQRMYIKDKSVTFFKKAKHISHIILKSKSKLLVSVNSGNVTEHNCLRFFKGANEVLDTVSIYHSLKATKKRLYG